MTEEEAKKQADFHKKNHLESQMSHCVDECVAAALFLIEKGK